MKRPSLGLQLILLIWMGLAVAVYLLTALPIETPLTAKMPAFLVHLRDILLPFFYSKSLLS